MTKLKAVACALVVLAAGWYGFARNSQGDIPTDLRDAVADNGEFSTSLPALDKNSGNIPAPKAEVDSASVITMPFAYTEAARQRFAKKFGRKGKISRIRVFGLKSNREDMMLIGVYSPRPMSFTCDAMEVGVRKNGTLVEISTIQLGTLLMGEPLYEPGFRISLDQARKIAAMEGFDIPESAEIDIFGTTYRLYDRNHNAVDISGNTGAVIGTDKGQ